jgi:hypothetical protein
MLNRPRGELPLLPCPHAGGGGDVEVGDGKALGVDEGAGGGVGRVEVPGAEQRGWRVDRDLEVVPTDGHLNGPEDEEGGGEDDLGDEAFLWPTSRMIPNREFESTGSGPFVIAHRRAATGRPPWVSLYFDTIAVEPASTVNMGSTPPANPHILRSEPSECRHGVD